MTESQQEINKIKAAILAAAQERFRKFGYGKTTMAEIAEDVNMSAANLYRYFHNKQDIAAECTGQCMADLDTELEKVVNLPNLDSTQRLHLYVQTTMRHYYEMMHDVPRLHELIENITSNYPQLIHEKNKKNEGQIASILKQGIDEGAFMVDDIKISASAVAKATAMFSTPFFMQIYSIEEFEKMAVNVVTLIINGLRKTN